LAGNCLTEDRNAKPYAGLRSVRAADFSFVIFTTIISQLFNALRPFQIIFNPISAAELAKMPKELQLQILGEFRGLPQQVMQTELDEFGKLERAGRTLHRFRVGDYRVYFERHELGVVVHRILSRHTLKDFLFRSGLKMQEDEALQQNPKFWELIESAKTTSKKG
jgi:mRNA-degrading endonuclease RelE of RelBE toxin-antitoxin system